MKGKKASSEDSKKIKTILEADRKIKADENSDPETVEQILKGNLRLLHRSKNLARRERGGRVIERNARRDS